MYQVLIHFLEEEKRNPPRPKLVSLINVTCIIISNINKGLSLQNIASYTPDLISFSGTSGHGKYLNWHFIHVLLLFLHYFTFVRFPFIFCSSFFSHLWSLSLIYYPYIGQHSMHTLSISPTFDPKFTTLLIHYLYCPHFPIGCPSFYPLTILDQSLLSYLCTSVWMHVHLSVLPSITLDDGPKNIPQSQFISLILI